MAGDLFGEIDDRHALQPDLTGSRQLGEEQAIAAKDHIADALDQLEIDADAGFMSADMTDMDQQALANTQPPVDDLSGEVIHRRSPTPSRRWMTSPERSKKAVPGPLTRCSTMPIPPNNPTPSRCCQTISSATDFSAQRKVSRRQIRLSPAARVRAMMVPGKRG